MSKKALILSIPIVIFLTLLGGLFAFHPQKPALNGQKPPVVEGNPTQPTGKSQEVQTPDTDTAIDTSNWKTYRNENTGIELKIPQDWDALVLLTGNDGDAICFGKKGELYPVVGGEGVVNGCAIMTVPDSRKDTKTLTDVYTKIIPRSRDLKNVFTEKNVEVGSRKSVLLSYAVGSIELYVEHRNNLYKIELRPFEYNYGDSTVASYYRNIYFSILSTIHFLD